MDTFILIANMVAVGLFIFPVFFGWGFGSTMADRVIYHFRPEIYPYYYEDVEKFSQRDLKKLRSQIIKEMKRRNNA